MNEKVHLGVMDEMETMYTYHPHYGFITNHTLEKSTEVFECLFHRDGIEQKTNYFLDIEST